MSSTSERSQLTPDAAPAWLKPLVDNAHCVKRADRRRVPADLLARISAASKIFPPMQTVPPRETTRSTSTAAPCSIGGSGDGPALAAPWMTSRARSFTVR